MGDKTGIEWTDATWNPVTGCTKVSPGCDHCYAETIAHRFAGTKAYPAGFKVTLRPERLEQPLRWRKPRRIFVNSMSDLFHADIPDDYITEVFDVMEQATHHTFQVLTKRPGRMRSFLLARKATRTEYADKFALCPTEKMRTSPAAKWARERAENAPDNVWLGVSVEDQKWADVRIPVLLDTPAAVRFISAEPLLGPVALGYVQGLDVLRPDWIGGPSGGTGAPHPLLDWVIVGGESGSAARPMHVDWAREIRDQCEMADVAFLFKQWGSHDSQGRRSSKKAAGRELDGVTHDGYPDRVVA